jgi:hypothetical protein
MVFLLVGVSTALWAPRLSGPIDLRYDGGVYYILGTSLAEGKGYRLLNEPGEIQAVQYPPLLPALVAVEQKILGTNDPAVVGHWLRLTYFGLFTAYVLAAYTMARQFLAPVYAGYVGVIAASNLDNLFLSDLLFADVPYGLAACLLVILNRRDTARASAGAALAGVAAYLLRTTGIALLAAWAGESLLRRRWQQAAWRGAIAAAPVLAWQGYIRHVESGPEYRQPAYAYQRAPYQFYNVSYATNIRLVDGFSPETGDGSVRGLVARGLRNLPLMPATLGEGISGRKGNYYMIAVWLRDKTGLGHLEDGSDVTKWLVTALGCLVLVGLGNWARRGEWFFPLFLGASLVLICLTPWPGQFPRYLTPLSPFLTVPALLVLFRFRDWARARLPGDWKGLALLPLALFLFVTLEAGATGLKYGFVDRSQNTGKLFFYDPAWAEYDRALAWLGGRAQSGEVIATWAPHWAYLWTGRLAVMPPMVPDAAEAQRLLDSVPVTYLIVDEFHFMYDLDGHTVGGKYTDLLPLRNADQWEPIYCPEASATLVYRRKGR